MRKHSNMAAALALAAGLAGCASQTLDDFNGATPTLDLRAYLDGPLAASGVFFDRSGRANIQFVVEMRGAWNGDEGTLTERFRYSDGRLDQRVWTIRFHDDRRFTATAHDVVGEAEGEQNGNAAVMRYRLRIPRESGEVVVSMEDWLYLQEDGSLINRTRMSKYGVTVGELVVAFRKPET